MAISPKLVDEILKDYQSPDDLLGDNGLLQQLTKAPVERALQGELTHHLGYDKHSPKGKNSGNSRSKAGSRWVGSEIHLHRILLRLGKGHIAVGRSSLNCTICACSRTRYTRLHFSSVSWPSAGCKQWLGELLSSC
jgi:hypothetical protein